MSGHGGARKKAGRPRKSAQPPPPGQPLFPGASLPNASGRAPAVTAEQARLDREDQARREEVRLGREEVRLGQEAANDAHMQQVEHEQEQARVREEEARRQRFIDRCNKLFSEVNGNQNRSSDDDDFDDDDFEDDERDEDLDIHPRRRVTKRKPPKDSVLARALEKIKGRITSPAGKEELKRGRQWYLPESDPVSALSADAENWYRPPVFAFLPFLQFHRWVGNSPAQKDAFKCVHCKVAGKLNSNGYYWRPMHHPTLSTVWCLHRRYVCTDCKCTFAEIDPRFLKQLPTPVVERFPFLSSRHGPGLHESMLYQFLHLATKGILFGTYVNMVNEQKRLQHSQAHVSFLDTLHHRRSGDRGHFDQLQPELFAAYYSPGDYHGIDLTTAVLKRYFYRFLEGGQEGYMQNSFQLTMDEGGSADLTYKTARKVFAPGRAGKLYKASLSKLALRGKLEVSRFTFTQGNEEIELLVKDYRKVRINAGHPQLLRHEGDEGGDKVLWARVFEELSQTVRKYKPPTIDGLVRAKIKSSEYEVITSIQAANDWATALVDAVARYLESDNDPHPVIYVGFDAEWNIRDGTRDITRTVQISFPKEIDEKVRVLNFTAMGVFTPDNFPNAVKQLLELPKIMLVGVNVSGDVDRLRNLGVGIKKSLDVGELAKHHVDNAPQGYSLAALAARYLQLGVDKCSQDSDWAQQPLSDKLSEYCALDARLSLQLLVAILPKVKEAIQENGPATEAISDLPLESTVHFYYQGKVCAIADLVFVGDGGVQQKWGKVLIGKGKSLIRLRRVITAGVKPPFFFSPDETEERDGKVRWPRDTTLKSLLANADPSINNLPVIAVPTGRLKKPLSSVSFREFQTPTRLQAESEEGAMEVDTTAPTTMDPTMDPPANESMTGPGTAEISGGSPETEEGRMEEVGDTGATIDPPANENAAGPVGTPGTGADRIEARSTSQCTFFAFDEMLDVGDYDSDDESDDESIDDGAPRSRDKSDIFHIFQNNPLTKDCPVRASVSRLLIHATFEFDVDDYKAVTSFLARRYGIKTVDDILRHFYFHREWWRRRCRMYTPAPKDHAMRIRRIHKYITDTEPLNKYYTEELQKYLVGLERKCEEGLFEELGDVSLFQWDGTDYNGLDLWLRFRGSNRAENLHQKMSVAFGPWGVGARTAHYVLLLVSYRYNVHTGIRRYNAHNFGHTWLHFIDRIQSRIVNIFGVDVYPRHTNQAQFEPVKDYVAVGIGPLNYNDDYVTKGPPDPLLKGDLRFVADRMRLKCPPMPVAHPREKKMFNDHMKAHPKPTDKDWRELAKRFKQQSDCKIIFPKLPTMLKSYYKKWRDNQLIVLAELKMKEPYDALLRDLAVPSQPGRNTAVENQGGIRRELPEDRRPLPLLPPLANAMPVPPAAAPGQTEFVGAKTAGGQRSRQRCYYRPFCTKMAEECHGFKKGGCIEVIEKRVIITVTPEEHKKQKDALDLVEKSKKEAARRIDRKRARRDSEGNA
jgi:hypothetical protein